MSVDMALALADARAWVDSRDDEPCNLCEALRGTAPCTPCLMAEAVLAVAPALWNSNATYGGYTLAELRRIRTNFTKELLAEAAVAALPDLIARIEILDRLLPPSPKDTP